MKILFVMLHAGFVRNYEGAIRELVARGHHVHIACETGRTKLNDAPLLDEVVRSGGVTTGAAPVRAEGVRTFLARSDRGALRAGDDAGGAPPEIWDALAATVRLALDYLRYFEPEYAHAPKLKARAEKRLPRVFRAAVDAIAWCGPLARRAAARLLGGLESAIPVPLAIGRFVRDERPDLVLVTPLVEFGSEQVDYVKCARHLGIPTALCVASWDNLTNKGVMRVVPDRVIVWNEAQRQEAAALHRVPPDRVTVTGAQIFDPWFDATATRTREEFCGMVGLRADRPFILYTGSSSFIAPNEYQFAAAWIDAIRRSSDPVLAGAGILIRPHPANTRRWWVLDQDALTGVAIWPPLAAEQRPAEFKADYVDSLHYCAAVVGVNTSAQIEAAILGRPVCTVRAPEFAHSQEGMPHFRHLLEAGGGLLVVAGSLAEHVEQLSSALADASHAADRSRRFVEAFVRPHGLERAATPIFVDAVEATAALRVVPRQESPVARGLRPVLAPLAWLVRLLAEDRPLWVYPLRPVLASGVHAWAAGIRVRTLAQEGVSLGMKRGRRLSRVAGHELGRWSRRVQHRALKRGRQVSAAILRVFPSARR